MAAKPIIGINGDFRPARKDAQQLSWYNSGYYESVTAAKGMPVLIPPLADDSDLKQFLSMLDGLVLAGCTFDLDPVRLGMDRHPSTRPMSPLREDFDRRLCKMAIDMKMPILAIGQGMQLLNVLCGGTLFQHVPEDCPKSFQHYDPVENTTRHVIDIVEGTRMWDIYGPGEIRVNSMHHQAVNTVAKPFRVCATSPDGVIEAYETVDDSWYAVGVQWHPENETASALDLQVFQHFIEFGTAANYPQILPFSKAA